MPFSVQAVQGVADDGKDNVTWDISDLKLRTEISAATASDCNNLTYSDLQSKFGSDSSKIDQLCTLNTRGIYRIGLEKNKSYLIVKYSYFLDSPAEIHVAPKSWGDVVNDFTFNLLGPGVPKVDYVKVNGLIGGFGSILHPILGLGISTGLSGTEICSKKVLSYPWEEEESINSCNFDNASNGRKDTFQPDKETTWKTGSPLRTAYYLYAPSNNFNGLANIKDIGKTYNLAFWPSWYLNVGNRSVKEKVIISAAATAAAKVAPGIGQKALEVANQVKNGTIDKATALKNLITGVKTAAPAAAAAISEAELLALGQGAITWAENLLTWPGNTHTVEEIASRAAGLAAKEAISKGAKAEQVVVLISQITADLGASAGMDAAAATSLAEKVAVKAGVAAGATEQVAASGARAATKLGKVTKFFGPALNIIGPIFNGVQLTFSVAGFRSEHIDLHDSNKNIVSLQLYSTEAEAQSHKDDPPPADATSNLASQTGAGSIKGGGGDPITWLLKEVIGGILGILQEIIYFVFSFFVAPLIQAMLSIHPYTDAFVAVIYPGWIVIRNLCNILFILAIIIIAMGTLFRVEAYQFKHLLVQLIIAALLINFSLVIGQAILGLADTVQAQFLPANVTVIRSLAGNLMVKAWRQTIINNALDFKGTFSDIVQQFFFIALSLGSFAVFVAIMIFLVIRIIALWVLLLVSPIAYACGVLPSTTSYRGQWWQYFIKYAFFTPIMAFFLNLTAVMVDQFVNKDSTLFQTLADPNLSQALGNSGIATFVFRIASNILLLVFLLAGLKIADMAGIMGAAGITGLAQKGIFAPFAGAGFLAKVGGGFAARKYSEFTTGHSVAGEKDKKTWGRSLAFAALNPVATFKGWQKRGKELSEAAEHKAEATGMMVVEQRLTGGHKVIARVQQHAKAEADKFVKDFNSGSREKQVNTMQDIIQLGFSEEAKAMKRAMTTSMMSRGFVDDAVQDGTQRKKNIKTGKLEDSPILKKMFQNSHFKVEKPEWEHETENKDWYVDEKDGVYKMRYDYHQMNALFEALFGIDDQEALRMLAEEGEKYGKETYHPEYMAGGHFDMDEDEYRWALDMVKDGKFAGDAFIGSEWSKMGYRQQAQIVFHALRGRGGKMHDNTVKNSSKSMVEGISYGQERNSSELAFGTDKVVDGENFDAKSGAIVVGPQTYLHWKDSVERLKLPGTMLANYSRATGGKLTGGKTDQVAIRGLEEDLKFIQSNPTADYATAKAANNNKDRAITEEHWDAVRANGGIKITVKNARDMHKIVSTDPAVKLAPGAVANETVIVDYLGAVGPEGGNVPVNMIKF